MPLWSRLPLRVKRTILWLGILVTLTLAIFPELLVSNLGPIPVSQDLASKIFAGINAILLTVLAFVQESLGRSLAVPIPIAATGAALPSAEGLGLAVNSAPLDIVVIFGAFPTLRERTYLQPYLRKLAILANYKSVATGDEGELSELLRNRSVRGVIADERDYERVIYYFNKRQTPAVFFGIRPDKHLSLSGGGARIKIGLPDKSPTVEELSKCARVLTAYHGPDTPRGVGFQGNWAGTYGLIALTQADDLRIEGKYWYGHGILSGTCDIDEANERLIFRYSFGQQRGSVDTIGSSNSGKGIFVIPAGYDFMYGFWYAGDDPGAAMGWEAARLSEDITTDILNGGPFGRDFGLSQHPKSDLVRW